MKNSIFSALICVFLLSSCAIKPGKLAVAVAQAPIAESLLYEYMKDDEFRMSIIRVQLLTLKELHTDFALAAESPKTFGKWVEDNWWRTIAAVQDWNTVKYYVLQHASQPGAAPLPDGLLVFNANVEAGFAIGRQRGKQELWQEAGLEILRVIATIVAAKNGVVID